MRLARSDEKYLLFCGYVYVRIFGLFDFSIFFSFYFRAYRTLFFLKIYFFFPEPTADEIYFMIDPIADRGDRRSIDYHFYFIL